MLIFILLQSDLNNMSSDLINKLGEWSTVIIIISYLIYQLIKDNQRNKKEALKNSASLKLQNAIYEQLEACKTINKELASYLKTISLQYADQINETQMRILVDKILDVSKYALISYISKIIRENNIYENENEIKAKIKMYIQNRYENDVLIFKEYAFRGDTLEKAMNNTWVNELINILINIVLSQKSEKIIESTLTNKFDEYKNKMLINLLNRK